MSKVAAKGPDPQPIERRPFLVRFTAGIVSIVAVLAPFVAGWGIVFDPLYRRKRAARGDGGANGDEFIRVGALDALPADGTPRLFVLTADRNDAWTRIKNQRIGTVFLSRDDADGSPRVKAFTSACPHLGCAVDYSASAKQFACPCHEASFAVDGSRISGPSKRGLDELPVELRAGAGDSQDIYVAYKTFRPGIEERTPIA